jgi:hypothetical protein
VQDGSSFAAEGTKTTDRSKAGLAARPSSSCCAAQPEAVFIQLQFVRGNGDDREADRLFRQAARSGQVIPVPSTRYLIHIFAPRLETEMDEEFRRAYESAEQRLRDRY